MFTAGLMLVFLGFAVIPAAFWMLGLVLRMAGWMVKSTFRLLGLIFLLPLGLLAFGLAGVLSLAWVVVPIVAIVGFVLSAISEE